MKVIENVIDREVLVVKVASSELGDSWTLAEKVRNSFLLMSIKEAFFFFFFFFFLAALTDLTLTSKRPMNSMGPTGAQKSAPGPIFQDRHSGNIVNNVSRGGGALPKIDCHRSRV